MIALNVQNETSPIESVVLGIPNDFGGTPRQEDCYDPKSREHVHNGTFPTQEDISSEMNHLLAVFKRYEVSVYRPENIPGLNQVFSRDIGFVIDDTFVIPNIIAERAQEVQAIRHIHELIAPEKILITPSRCRIEGGDVMLNNEYVFVGYSEESDFNNYQVARTDANALDFLGHHFPAKKVMGFELQKSDTNAYENALHLDCCFQPIGTNSAILYEGGFKNQSDVDFLVDFYKKENIIFITQEEMYQMCANVFSLSPQVIITEQGFTRLNAELRKRGFTVEEVPYAEIAKMEGLLRCSTLPLRRK